MLELILVVLFVVVAFWVASTFLKFIPNNAVGIVEKLYGGKPTSAGKLIAQDDENGFQPQVLRGGIHFFFPTMFRIHSVPLVTIPQGRVGYIFARDGVPLGPDQALATNQEAADFQDV